MSEQTQWHEDLVLPVLLAEGRKTYGAAIRRAFAAEGFDDIPKLGPRLLGGMLRFGSQPADIAADFGISKQAASKLVDALVVRGYLERRVDPDDRRRMLLSLTARGEAAARASGAATDRVDRELEEAVGERAVEQMRETLGALVGLR
ncbi:MAG TPA: MarR family winged helix-turn-helix transcriptional regulator [Solirubrobacterales bacterium]|jgi:DNA-binding MarR family transcriptional regulator